MTHLDL